MVGKSRSSLHPSNGMGKIRACHPRGNEKRWMLGREDQEIARLESCDFSEAQKADPINYEVGQVVECHRRLKGDLRPGEQWEVTQVLPEAVVVNRNGREEQLPLGQSKDFNVCYRDTMPLAAGEHLLITKNNRRANLRNGDLRQVRGIDGNTIALDYGYKLDASKPLHIRQGYTMTSQASQGHENPKMFAFLPVSATSQINAVQMLVSLSRASREVRLYTDSKAVLKKRQLGPSKERQCRGSPPSRSSPPRFGSMVETDILDAGNGHRIDPTQLAEDLQPGINNDFLARCQEVLAAPVV